MMMRQLERVRRRLWTYKQPITHAPTQQAVPISDLFTWRNSDQWETYFELYNIPALLDLETEGQQTVELTLFDQHGSLLSSHLLHVDNCKRHTISLRNFLDSNYGECGTFAVFHLHYPESIAKLGCFVAERGYVSYRYNNSPMRSYVHGNLDAVAKLPAGKLELLGARSFLKRDFRLQFLNQGMNSIELFLANPTNHLQRLSCSFLTSGARKLLGCAEIEIPPGGVRVVERNLDSDDPVYVEIKSKLVMARPLVFTFQNSGMDVFHG